MRSAACASTLAPAARRTTPRWRARAAPARRSRPARRAAGRGRARCAPSALRCRSGVTQTSCAGQFGTRPWLGRKPNTLFQAAGLRRLPIEVAAVGHRQHARGERDRRAAAAAAGRLRVGSKALRVAPNTSLKVCEPRPNSGVLVLPMTMQPAAFMRCTISESAAGTKSLNSGEPEVLRMPAVGTMSLIACGRPNRNGRGASPASLRTSSRSQRSASSSSSSPSRRLTIALCRGLSAAMRSRKACITSRQDTSPAAMAAASSWAARSVSAAMALPSFSASRTSSAGRSPTSPARAPAAPRCRGRAPRRRRAGSR